MFIQLHRACWSQADRALPAGQSSRALSCRHAHMRQQITCPILKEVRIHGRPVPKPAQGQSDCEAIAPASHVAGREAPCAPFGSALPHGCPISCRMTGRGTSIAPCCGLLQGIACLLARHPDSDLTRYLDDVVGGCLVGFSHRLHELSTAEVVLTVMHAMKEVEADPDRPRRTVRSAWHRASALVSRQTL